jgi:hypothetical protein
LTGNECFAAAASTRFTPGSSGATSGPAAIMMRMPTVPGVFFQSAMVSATLGSAGSTGFTTAKRPGCLLRTSSA